MRTGPRGTPKCIKTRRWFEVRHADTGRYLAAVSGRDILHAASKLLPLRGAALRPYELILERPPV